MKITVVGAGNVGATVANVLAIKKFASEIVLIDIKEGVSEGKAMDMMQSAHALGYDTTVRGVTNDYAATAGSDVVVVTSGLPRKPGMTREELVGVNAKIVKSVVGEALKHSPNAIFIIISNPMDAMTYLTLKATGLPRNRVIGMGGMLADGRRRYGHRRSQRQDDGSARQHCDAPRHPRDAAPLEASTRRRCAKDEGRRCNADGAARHVRMVCARRIGGRTRRGDRA